MTQQTLYHRTDNEVMVICSNTNPADFPDYQLEKSDVVLAAEARSVRNRLLETADIDILRALEDGSDATAIKTYRQALRDITTHANWPDLADSDWPTKP